MHIISIIIRVLVHLELVYFGKLAYVLAYKAVSRVNYKVMKAAVRDNSTTGYRLEDDDDGRDPEMMYDVHRDTCRYRIRPARKNLRANAMQQGDENYFYVLYDRHRIQQRVQWSDFSTFVQCKVTDTRPATLRDRLKGLFPRIRRWLL